MKSALFPGSFDPITNGHVNVIHQASDIFDKVFVVVMTNTAKNYLFTANERFKFVKSIFENNPKVKVLKRPDALTVEVAKELKAQAIVRGVRNSNDFMYEQQIATVNKRIAPDLHTLLFFTKEEDSFIASSMIKEIASFGGDVDSFVPAIVAKGLAQKFWKKNEKK